MRIHATPERTPASNRGGQVIQRKISFDQGKTTEDFVPDPIKQEAAEAGANVYNQLMQWHTEELVNTAFVDWNDVLRNARSIAAFNQAGSRPPVAPQDEEEAPAHRQGGQIPAWRPYRPGGAPARADDKDGREKEAEEPPAWHATRPLPRRNDGGRDARIGKWRPAGSKEEPTKKKGFLGRRFRKEKELAPVPQKVPMSGFGNPGIASTEDAHTTLYTDGFAGCVGVVLLGPGNRRTLAHIYSGWVYQLDHWPQLGELRDLAAQAHTAHIYHAPGGWALGDGSDGDKFVREAGLGNLVVIFHGAPVTVRVDPAGNVTPSPRQ